MVRQVAKRLAGLFCDEKIDIVCVLGGPYVGKSWLVESYVSGDRDNGRLVFDNINSYEEFKKIVDEKTKCGEKCIIVGRLLEEKCRQYEREGIRIEYVNVYPLNFAEFKVVMPKKYNIQPMQMLKIYMLVGGLPEVIKVFLDTGDIDKVRRKQVEILQRIEEETDRKQRAIIKSVIAQEQCDGTGFFLSKIDRNARKREYEGALNSLLDMGVIEKRLRYAPKLNVDVRKYKLHIYDLGLYLTAIEFNNIQFINSYKGWDKRLLYKFMIMDLRTYIDKREEMIMYWSKYKAKANIPMIIKVERGMEEILFPVGIKENVRLLDKSVSVFMKEYINVRPINMKIPLMEEVEDGLDLYYRISNNA